MLALAGTVLDADVAGIILEVVVDYQNAVVDDIAVDEHAAAVAVHIVAVAAAVVHVVGFQAVLQQTSLQDLPRQHRSNRHLLVVDGLKIVRGLDKTVENRYSGAGIPNTFGI